MQYLKKMTAIMLDCAVGVIWLMFYWHIIKYCFEAFVFCGPKMVGGHFNMYVFCGWILIFAIAYFKPCIQSFKTIFSPKTLNIDRLGLLIQNIILMLAFLLCGAFLYWVCSYSDTWGKAYFCWCHTETHDQIVSFLRGYHG